MRLIVVAGRRKREINGPFSFIVGRREAEHMRNIINAWLAEPGNGCGISYGYIDFPDTLPTFVDGPPEPWDTP